MICDCGVCISYFILVSWWSIHDRNLDFGQAQHWHAIHPRNVCHPRNARGFRTKYVARQLNYIQLHLTIQCLVIRSLYTQLQYLPLRMFTRHEVNVLRQFVGFVGKNVDLELPNFETNVGRRYS